MLRQFQYNRPKKYWVLKGFHGGGPRVETVDHPFATLPNLESHSGEATEKLLQAIDIAATTPGARYIYLLEPLLRHRIGAPGLAVSAPRVAGAQTVSSLRRPSRDS